MIGERIALDWSIIMDWPWWITFRLLLALIIVSHLKQFDGWGLRNNYYPMFELISIGKGAQIRGMGGTIKTNLNMCYEMLFTILVLAKCFPQFGSCASSTKKVLV
jgi:hypothetical protein